MLHHFNSILIIYFLLSDIDINCKELGKEEKVESWKKKKKKGGIPSKKIEGKINRTLYCCTTGGRECTRATTCTNKKNVGT